MSRLRPLVHAVRGRLHPLDALREALPRADRRARAPRPAHDPAAPDLVLSPHLDDAVLSCWWALTASRGLTVVNVFAGEPPAGVLAPYDRIAGAADSASRMARRADEDRQALSLAGRSPVNLSFLEASYRSRAPSASAVLAGVASRVPAAAAVLAPAAVALHPDHVLVRRAALRLARAGMPVRLYADLPYCVVYGWPAWVTGREPSPHLDVDAFWAPALDPLREAGFELEPAVHALDPGAQRAKLAALRRYATQYPTLSRGPLDVLAHPAVLSREVSWSVRPRPRRGGRGSTRTA